MSKFTQGDWTISESGLIVSDNLYEGKGQIEQIAKVFCGFDVENTKAEAEANLKLIAAAPYLLQVCETTLAEIRAINSVLSKHGLHPFLLTELELVDAIERATGEKP